MKEVKRIRMNLHCSLNYDVIFKITNKSIMIILNSMVILKIISQMGGHQQNARRALNISPLVPIKD